MKEIRNQFVVRRAAALQAEIRECENFLGFHMDLDGRVAAHLNALRKDLDGILAPETPESSAKQKDGERLSTKRETRNG